jgi:hypothetical protein
MEWLGLALVAIAAAVGGYWLWPRLHDLLTGARERGVEVATPPRPGLPAPGEVWWADVPFEDGTGSKIRPCLVVRSGADGAAVLKITSQDQSRRDGYRRIPTATWKGGEADGSWLDMRHEYPVRLADFRDRAGVTDLSTWKVVSRSFRTGWDS